MRGWVVTEEVDVQILMREGGRGDDVCSVVLCNYHDYDYCRSRY